MHIALFIDHFSAETGGAEAFAVTVVRELLRRKHQVTVCAVDGDGIDGVQFQQVPAVHGTDVFADVRADITLDWGLNVSARLHRLGGGTHREFQRIRLEAVPRPVRTVKQCLYAMLPQHRRLARRERGLLQQPDTHVLAVSRFVAEQVKHTVDFPADRTHVLHNGVDVNRFSPRHAARHRQPQRVRWGLTDSDVAFLMVAHNLSLKNLALLRRVFRAVSPRVPQAKLVLLGKRDPGIRADWFVYAGQTRAPETAYAAADCLLHPTFYDACANVVLEAMASALPVVSSDRNGSAEKISHGTNGFVLPVVGPAQTIEQTWEQTVETLCRHPEQRRDLGREAGATAQHWTIEHYVDDLENILRSIRRQNRSAHASPNHPPVGE